MIINPNFITKVIAMLLGITIISVTLAHQGATGIVKERMDMMKSMGDANKAIGDMIKGKTTFDAAQIAEHARTINRQSQDILGHFPEGSLQKVSEALPQIWEDWPRFEHITQQLRAIA